MTTQILVRNGEGENFDYSQDHCFIKLQSSITNGGLSMVEDWLKPGFKLGRHYHKLMTEVFYVLEGEIQFIMDDQTLTLLKGDTLTIPPNTWHAAQCIEGGRMLTIFKNGRFDEYLQRLDSMTKDQLQDHELMKSLAEEYDIFES